MIIVKFLSIVCGVIFSKYLFTIFQLNDYHTFRYLDKLKCRIFVIPLSIILLILEWKFCELLLLFYTLTIVSFPLIFSHKNLTKTPIKITPRIKHDYVIFFFLTIALSVVSPTLYFGIYLLLPPICNHLNILDNIRNKHLIKLASKKIKLSQAKVIAITGSNGKTSIKNFLFQMLKTKYNVIASPKSYNTPIGNAIFINNNLKYDTEFVILEYGARHIGDIKKLCNLFGADYGIISSVAPQHLKYFHTIENIYKAKSELSTFLLDKPCVYNLSNLYTLRMYLEKHGMKLGETKTDVRLEDFMSSFFLLNKLVTTQILGEENIQNIRLASALASHLGVDDTDIIKVIENLHPTEHRLQYIKSTINILDDSYNCSIASAKQSVNVLNSTNNKKMIVTPGIIEGGKYEYSLNLQLGRMLNKIDYIVIVGEHNKKALLDGIRSNNSYSKIFCVKTLEQAKSYFNLLSSSDTLLLLNDLPDDYD